MGFPWQNLCVFSAEFGAYGYLCVFLQNLWRMDKALSPRSAPYCSDNQTNIRRMAHRSAGCLLSCLSQVIHKHKTHYHIKCKVGLLIHVYYLFHPIFVIYPIVATFTMISSCQLPWCMRKIKSCRKHQWLRTISSTVI